MKKNYDSVFLEHIRFCHQGLLTMKNVLKKKLIFEKMLKNMKVLFKEAGYKELK